VIIAVGAYARIVIDGATTTAGTAKRLYSFPTLEALESKIASIIEPGDTVLLKASRAVGLERLMGTLELSRAEARAVGRN
jgi:UDP-N-acetylmuramyl pentapeptide synthase